MHLHCEKRPLASKPLWQRFVATAVLITLSCSPTGLGLLPSQALAAPVSDPLAPLGFRPQVLNTSNGVPMVHITAPNAAGLSVNRYQRFDVDAVGLILNNGLIAGSSQLGGAVSANPNLSGQPARLILNEVRASAGSVLIGPVEVFGSPAALILANPNGITVNGARFINSPRVTLTTGVPLFTGPGGLSTDFDAATGLAYDIRSGRVSVGALGVIAPGRLDLLAETVRLEGSVSATDALNLVGAASASRTTRWRYPPTVRPTPVSRSKRRQAPRLPSMPARSAR